MHRRIPLLATAALLLLAAAGRAESEAGLDLEPYRGKVVIVDFWASWCAPCRRSFPWLESMQRKYGDDGLVVIGVNEDSEPAAAEAFLSDTPVSFRIVRDPGGRTAEHFGLVAMPMSYVIGRGGEFVARHAGFKVAKTDDYEALIRRALGLSPAVAAD